MQQHSADYEIKLRNRKKKCTILISLFEKLKNGVKLKISKFFSYFRYIFSFAVSHFNFLGIKNESSFLDVKFEQSLIFMKKYVY